MLDLWDESDGGSDTGPFAEHIPEAEGLRGTHQRHAAWRLESLLTGCTLCGCWLSESFVNICVVKGDATALINNSEPGNCLRLPKKHELLY